MWVITARNVERGFGFTAAAVEILLIINQGAATIVEQ